MERGQAEAHSEGGGDARIDRVRLAGRVMAIKACVTKEVEDQVRSICNRNVEILSVPFTPVPAEMSNLHLDIDSKPTTETLD